MSFTSVLFIFGYFPLCAVAYKLSSIIEHKSAFAEKLKLRQWILIAASLGFYLLNAGVNTVVYLCVYVIAVYAMGKLLEKKKGVLPSALCLTVLIAVLYYCKYFNYVGELVNGIAGRKLITVQAIIAPLGVSFVTFSAISYILDIRRGDAECGSFADAALYLTFFPKVASGPIVLWKNFRQLMAHSTLSAAKYAEGIERICLGFAKKLILADSFGAVISQMQANMDVPTAWLCALLYMLQIYYDFAGYSDIAIGLAKLFGFDFKENFDFPYVSLSITEFWRRWHISLGEFFKEYVYIPLGGNRKGLLKTLRNIAIVFLISGVWHGAGWGYLCWGMMHGACQIIERCLRDKKIYKKTPDAVKWICTMFVVMVGWEFFRIGGFADTLKFIKLMFGMGSFEWIPYTWQYFLTPKTVTLLVIGIVGATVFSAPALRKLWARTNENKGLYAVKMIILLALFALSIVFMVNSSYSPFIYFRY